MNDRKADAELDDLDLERVAGGGANAGKATALTCGAACTACAVCNARDLPPDAPVPRNVLRG